MGKNILLATMLKSTMSINLLSINKIEYNLRKMGYDEDYYSVGFMGSCWYVSFNPKGFGICYSEMSLFAKYGYISIEYCSQTKRIRMYISNRHWAPHKKILNKLNIK